MCVIIAKDKADRLPTIDELSNCFTSNRDGAGFMYVNNGKVIIDKGYMTEEKFLHRFKHLCAKFNDFKDKALVIHCRIGTAGTNTAQNTHPYPITVSINKMHKNYTTASIGIAHNGIITEYNPKSIEDDTNDTQEFISKFLAPLYNRWTTFYKNDAIIDAIDRLTNSKFAILTKNDELVTIGNFVNHEGLMFSNTSYAPVIYYHHDKDADYYYNDWSDWYFSKNKDEKEEKEINYDNMVDIPSTYFVEYDEFFHQANKYNYCVDLDTECLYRYNSHLNEFEFVSNDFLIYNEEYEPILDYCNWLV